MKKLVWCITTRHPDDCDYSSIDAEYDHEDFEQAKNDLIEYSKESDYDFDEPMYLSEMVRTDILDFFPDTDYFQDKMMEDIEECIVDEVGDWFEIEDRHKDQMKQILNKAIDEIKKNPAFGSYCYSANIGKDYCPIYTIDQNTRELVKA